MVWQPSPKQKIGHPSSLHHPQQREVPVGTDTALRPYAEIIVAIKVKSTKPAHQRDARWDVEREGRETKV
ncbi:MAG: hypothetical protein RJA02_1111 [Armatimonadota bacterium]